MYGHEAFHRAAVAELSRAACVTHPTVRTHKLVDIRQIDERLVDRRPLGVVVGVAVALDISAAGFRNSRLKSHSD